jgi:hypothetical protein
MRERQTGCTYFSNDNPRLLVTILLNCCHITNPLQTRFTKVLRVRIRMQHHGFHKSYLYLSLSRFIKIQLWIITLNRIILNILTVYLWCQDHKLTHHTHKTLDY